MAERGRSRRGDRLSEPTEAGAQWLARELAEPAAQLGVEVDSQRWEALAGLTRAMLAWSRRINLTGARDARELVRSHVADALALMPDLDQVRGRLLDVGSGGGLPGLVVAILRPDLGVTLLEPIAKKHAFLRHAARELALVRVEARRERVEVHMRAPGFRPYDAAVSRATFPLPQWLALGQQLVRPGGRVLGLEGLEPAELPASAVRRSYRRPGSTRLRAVVRLERPA